MKGLYLYCIGSNPEKFFPGEVGIGGKEVLGFPYRDLQVVFQILPLDEYDLENPDLLAEWVQTYDKVVSLSWERLGAVIPVKFGTVIKDSNGKSARENLLTLLEGEYERFQQQLLHIREKAEYGVQIFWDKNEISEKICRENEEIRKLKKDVETKSKGMAFMLGKKLDNELKKEMDRTAEKFYKEIYEKIQTAADEIKVEKLKETDGKEMLINLSCLVDKSKVEEMEKVLEVIENQWNFEVRLVGPFPPYSFV
ncbi:MAG: GvpL/GvpF family gas vesicle protein [Chloroflexi bacterium]|nr:GvpL/GvpF family gas vesicle protein [Chloroflexota bacterium]